jgi:hypothetical protein
MGAHLEDCKGECNTKCKECKNDSSQKHCKKKRKICKEECDTATLCAPPPVCEDNDISGFGTAWCMSNAQLVTFCKSDDGQKKCKKTCSLCD